MNHKRVLGLLIVAAVVAAGALGLFYEHSEPRRRVAAQELQPIARLLQEDQVNLKELQAEPYTEKDSGILEAYLAKIRRDAVVRHAEFFQTCVKVCI